MTYNLHLYCHYCVVKSSGALGFTYSNKVLQNSVAYKLINVQISAKLGEN